MLASGKLTLTSKKLWEQCSKVTPRKPVKDCYCHYFEVNKMHARLPRTQHKSVSPCHCQDEFKLRPIGETGNKAALTSPISCETLRRVQKIDYAPRSQFLRNVQNKICEILQTADEENRLRSCPRSSSYHRFLTRLQDTVTDKKTALSECKRIDDRQESPTFLTAPANSLASEQSRSDDVTASSKRTRVSPRKLSKSTLRKSVRSRKQMPESSERLASKPLMQGKRTAQLRKQDCSCCYRNELERKIGGDKHAERYDLPEYCERMERCLKHDNSSAAEDFVDQEVENLRKFREQNYFETHGSNHTLTSSRSSESLQQYLLNERLFPEPVGKIHKQDLVVTMPPCATMQRKRVHYFPRYVVRQEKNACINYRRKRCQSCPLTGHAIDLGVLKTRPPLNSLALKYQKKAL